MNISTLLQRYLDGHLGRDHQAKRFILPLIGSLGSKSLEGFTVAEGIKFFEALDAKPAIKTSMIKYLGAAWNHSFLRGHITVPNPCSHIKKIVRHKEKRRAKAITADQYRKIFSVIREMENEDRNPFALLAQEFLLHTALRKMEVLNAKECDIDGDVLNIPVHKNDKDSSLSLKLTPEIKVIIQRAIKLKAEFGMQSSPYIFASYDGKHISAALLFNIWDELRRRASIEKHVQHNTRSGMINVLIGKGYTVEEISQYTGQSPDVIRTYYMAQLKHVAEELANVGGSIIGGYANG